MKRTDAMAKERQSDMAAIIDFLRGEDAQMVDLIFEDAGAIDSGNAFNPLDEIWLCEHGLLLSGDPHNKNSFNNNVIVSHPGSKTVRIILFEMRNRFRYLEKMNAIEIACEADIPEDDSYRGRLLNYRFDTLGGHDYTTIILTGPGLIFEVVMGLGFALLNLGDDVSPRSLSHALYSRKFGIAFMDQTFYTYDHSRSTWMRKPDGGGPAV
jgi:hypothetical protein